MRQLGRTFGALVLGAGLLLFSDPAQAADEPGAPGGGGAAGGAGGGGDSAPAGPDASSILSGGQGAPTPPPGLGGGSSKGFSGKFAGGLLFEQIEGDSFITLDLSNTFSFGPVSLGIWVPLRLRVIDEKPDNDGVFRKEDWDEVSDWARILRFVEINLGGKTWRFRGRFGALEGESIGHGTIIGGYYNVIDRAHYQAGLALSGALKWGGAEFMMDNLFGPEIFGARLHVRPTSFFTDNKWANKLIVGVSLAGDGSAPTRQIPDATNATIVGRDGEGNLQVETDFLTILGVDVEYELVRTKIVELVPYADLNFLVDKSTGVGFHLGFFFNLRVPIPILRPVLLTRMEYRAIGDGYAPRYIDSTYEAQRLSYNASNAQLVDPTSTLPLTKLGWLRSASSGANGWLGELYFDFAAGWVRVGGTYEDYTGDDNSALTLALILPKLQIVQAGAYYSNRGFDSITDAFELENAMLRAFVSFKAYGPLYLTASYTRTWALDAPPPDGDGKYKAQSNWNVGVGVQFNY